MTKTIIVIIIIVLIGAFIYMKYVVEKTPSIIGNNYDKNLQNEEINISDLQKRVNESNPETTFDMKNCNELIVQKFEHAIDQIPSKEFLVTDKDIINSLTNNLNTLPHDGEMFISFTSQVQYTKLTFFCENSKNYSVSFYGGSLQSPGTSFYDEDREGEKNVKEIIEKLISEH